MNRAAKIAIAAGAAFIVGAQLVPVSRTNPPVDPGREIDVPTPAKAVLERACFNCHSHRTVWPWYAYVAPVSWLVANDVRDARKHMNFSTWQDLRPDRQARKLAECAEEVEEGGMPPRLYRWAHPEAELTEADKAALRTLARETGGGERRRLQDDD